MKYYSVYRSNESKVKIWLNLLTRTPEEIAVMDEDEANFEQCYKNEWIEKLKSLEYQEYVKQYLRQYLPPHLASSYEEIEDILLRDAVPNTELKKQIDGWVGDPMSEYEHLLTESCKHYHKIKHQLPPVIVNELMKQSLHDCKILAVEIPSPDVIILTLENGGFRSYEFLKITFTGVEELVNLEQMLNSFWLYEEVYPTSTGFELYAFMTSIVDDATDDFEFKIIAKDVKVEEYGEKFW